MIRSVPFWIRLQDLSLQYSRSKCLSALVSTIGKPIMVDKFTRECSRVQFARIVVEMEITDNPPRTIQYLNEHGRDKSEEDAILSSRNPYLKKRSINEKVVVGMPKLVTEDPPADNGQIVCEKDWQSPKKVFYRGLNGPKKQVEVLNLCSKDKVGVGALLETKMRGSKVTEMMANKFLNWDYYSSSIIEGRILIIWRRVYVKVTVVEETSQFVHFFKAKDRDGGKPVSKAELFDSSQWLASSHLDVLKQKGSFFTWTNNQDGHARIYSKIDHVFTNEKWLDIFPNTTTVFKWETISEHCSCTLSIQTMELLGVKLFRDHIGDIEIQFQRTKVVFQDARLLAKKNPRDLTLQDNVKTAAETYISQEQIVLQLFDSKKSIMGRPISDNKKINVHCVELGPKLNVDQHLSLLKPFSHKEIRAALFSIPIIKSPGPDGFGSGFFKVMWQDIGDEICRAISQFFELGRIPEELLDTTLSLVPKCENPSRAVDYRPIACCSTLYKCISKLLYSRLAKVLPILVQSNQGAFVKGKSIAHNIMIFQDLIENYGRSTTSPRCAIKIDISKAYDTVDWWFIEDLLTALCFLERFIKWLMTCLKNTSYLLLMNGRVQGIFKGEKGLRQGDPLSPFLFVLIMEYLTQRLQLAALDSSFRYHPMCKSLNLLSLCFVDDLLLFCKGSMAAVGVLKSALEEFSAVTGLEINTSKSHVYFGGVSTNDRKKLATELQLSEGRFPLKYLGVRMRPTKWKHEDCDIIIQKFRMRINNWASRHLSFAGRIQLIHFVLFGLRNYWMGIFILPQSIIKEIEKLCRGFLWGVNGNQSKIHLESWTKVCLLKVYGGLGFKNGSAWNKAILAKYIWAITEKHDLLWVKWINFVYLKGYEFLSYRLPPDISWYWKKLCNLRDIYSYAELKAAGSAGKFHPSKLYNSSLCQQQIDYHRAVWCRLSIPKHIFLLWQTVNTQLLTCDNLLSLDDAIVVDVVAVLQLIVLDCEPQMVY
ncbi:uncharacterized protein LOC133799949 [Humulus lupulus]|uniref:uncharacterized protein LOC133799949 n=1 Tax=Humulus lupulus TaxID=3486 RepID=UPI002B40B70F|nr:uncharacterized protein LOC133799949 [Humulus lupulus]